MASLSKQKKKFGEIAVARGLITKWQLTSALEEQQEARAKGAVQKKIGSVLLEKGFIEAGDIKKVLDVQARGVFCSWLGALWSFKSGI